MRSPIIPKKRLGQHFLTDVNIAEKIVDSLARSCNTLIEVGPGTGVLTKYLIDRLGFVAMDVDTESVEYLKSEYDEFSSKILQKDFLKSNLTEMESPIAVIGNLPYNISSQIFFKIYENRDIVDEVVCMIQKEVADRIVSKEGNKIYGILSVLLQAFYSVEYLFTVKPHVFNPPPKVNSAVIRLARNDRSHLDCDETLFKRVVKSGFGKRRKTLRNALKELNLPADIAEQQVFSKRAEQLSVEQFISLTRSIENGDPFDI